MGMDLKWRVFPQLHCGGKNLMNNSVAGKLTATKNAIVMDKHKGDLHRFWHIFSSVGVFISMFFFLPSDKSRVWKWLWELQLYCFQRAGHRIQGVPAHSGRSALAFGWFISVNAFKWMQQQRSFKSTRVVCKITKKTPHSWPYKPRLNHIKPKPSTRIWDFPEQYLFWRLNRLTNTKSFTYPPPPDFEM